MEPTHEFVFITSNFHQNSLLFILISSFDRFVGLAKWYWSSVLNHNSVLLTQMSCFCPIRAKIYKTGVAILQSHEELRWLNMNCGNLFANLVPVSLWIRLQRSWLGGWDIYHLFSLRCLDKTSKQHNRKESSQKSFDNQILQWTSDGDCQFDFPELVLVSGGIERW